MGQGSGWMACGQCGFRNELGDLTLNPENALISACVSDPRPPFRRAKSPTMLAAPLAAPFEKRPHR